MRKTNLDPTKPKRKYKKYTRKGYSQAELREAIKTAHDRLIGIRPHIDRMFKKKSNI